MRILQVANSFKYAWSAGGVARVAFDISLDLTKKGHEVTVFTTDRALSKSYIFRKNQPIRLDGIEVYYFKNLLKSLANKGIAIPYYSPFVIARKLKEFDVIHIHEPKRIINVLIYHYAKKHRIPYVFQAHGGLPESRSFRNQVLSQIFHVLFTRRLLRDASKVIALTQMEKQQYQNEGVSEEKIEIIPNGIDLSEYVNLPSRGSFKKKFGIDEDKKMVLYLGRIHENKGIGFLVEAYAHLIEKMSCKDVILVIAGQDSGYLGQTKQLSKNLRIANKVIFTGALSQKEKIAAYVDSSLVVNVEPKNVYGLVPLEAAACSTPLIVSNGNAISEVIQRGKFGFSVKYGDIRQLAEVMEKMLNDEDLLKELGLRGRKFILKNYYWANILVKLENVYREVATGTEQCFDVKCVLNNG